MISQDQGGGGPSPNENKNFGFHLSAIPGAPLLALSRSGIREADIARLVYTLPRSDSHITNFPVIRSHRPRLAIKKILRVTRPWNPTLAQKTRKDGPPGVEEFGKSRFRA